MDFADIQPLLECTPMNPASDVYVEKVSAEHTAAYELPCVAYDVRHAAAWLAPYPLRTKIRIISHMNQRIRDRIMETVYPTLRAVHDRVHVQSADIMDVYHKAIADQVQAETELVRDHMANLVAVRAMEVAAGPQRQVSTECRRAVIDPANYSITPESPTATIYTMDWDVDWGVVFVQLTLRLSGVHKPNTYDIALVVLCDGVTCGRTQAVTVNHRHPIQLTLALTNVHVHRGVSELALALTCDGLERGWAVLAEVIEPCEIMSLVH
ncbi:ORF043 [Angelfish iridovirus AFIV-16]|nr:ORF043 [Angelfish iridovirus AFIV-16]